MTTFTIEELTAMKRQALTHGDLELARMYQSDIDELNNMLEEVNEEVEELREEVEELLQVEEPKEVAKYLDDILGDKYITQLAYDEVIKIVNGKIEENEQRTTQYKSNTLHVESDEVGATYINGKLVRNDKDTVMLMLEDLYLLDDTNKTLGSRLKAKVSFEAFELLLEEAKEYWNDDILNILWNTCKLIK